VSDVRPGRYAVITDRFRPRPGDVVSVVAGEQAEVRILAAVEHVVGGHVTDPAGRAVAGAAVWAAPTFSRGQDLAVLDYTDGAGRFRIEFGWNAFVIGARKDGFAPSKAVLVDGELQGEQPQVTEGVRLVLGGAGGGVRGRVVGEAGRALENAIVRVGVGPVNRLVPVTEAAEPPPREVRTDDAGSFEVAGCSPGEQAVEVRAEGYAPWSATCVVEAGQVAELVIELERAAGLQGIVKDAAGAPIVDCFVTIHRPNQLAYMWARTDAEGEYRLPDAPAGELDVEFKALHYLVASQRVACVAGQRNWLETVLEKGRVLHGVILDQYDRPVGRAVVAGIDTSGKQFAQSVSRLDGSFELVGCEEARCGVLVEKPDVDTRLAVCAVDAAEPAVVRVVSHGPRSALVKGTLIDAAALGVAGARVTLSRASEIRAPRVSTGSTRVGHGEFEIGPVSPGTYQLVVEPSGRPRILIEDLELAAHEVRDLGALRVQEGGRLHFESAAGSVPGARVSTYDLQGRWVGDCGIDGVSDALRPGEHMLRVHGPGVAEAMFTATVRVGVTSRVMVAAHKGAECEINVHRDGGGPAGAFKISVDPVQGVGRQRDRYWQEGQERFVERRVLGEGEFVVRLERDGVVTEQKILVVADVAPQVFRIAWR